MTALKASKIQVMDELFNEVRGFIHKHRQLTLAVCEGNQPYTAMSGYAWHAGGILIHLSNLSAHKRVLRANPHCSALIAEPDDGRAEVMSLTRLTLNGDAALLDKAGSAYADARAAFTARLPGSELMFGLPDFDLFHIAPSSGRFIAGFGRAYNLDLDMLERL